MPCSVYPHHSHLKPLHRPAYTQHTREHRNTAHPTRGTNLPASLTSELRGGEQGESQQPYISRYTALRPNPSTDTPSTRQKMPSMQSHRRKIHGAVKTSLSFPHHTHAQSPSSRSSFAGHLLLHEPKCVHVAPPWVSSAQLKKSSLKRPGRRLTQRPRHPTSTPLAPRCTTTTMLHKRKGPAVAGRLLPLGCARRPAAGEEGGVPHAPARGVRRHTGAAGEDVQVAVPPLPVHPLLLLLLLCEWQALLWAVWEGGGGRRSGRRGWWWVRGRRRAERHALEQVGQRGIAGSPQHRRRLRLHHQTPKQPHAALRSSLRARAVAQQVGRGALRRQRPVADQWGVSWRRVGEGEG
mmetsp:Transcript_21953/g.62496  ORF Transcript_21953/g.62496 Transcript_21953/m.62496 type:complete len:351 (-) Transcript_21953:735-1787(-)